jgi:hypothetical protein
MCREWGICARTWLQELAPIGLVKAVEGRDVRVVQRGEKVGLTLEPQDLLLILGQDVGKKLQSHVPPELGIASAIHLAHPARAEKGVDLENSQPGPSGKGHAHYATTAAGIETGTPAVIVDRRPWSDAARDGGVPLM